MINAVNEQFSRFVNFAEDQRANWRPRPTRRAICERTSVLQGAGIGGGSSSGGTYAGDIVITGGVVVATGASWAAGIGGGDLSSGGSVTVTGGKVTAEGGVHGPAIGASGYGGTYGAVTISGGTITTITDAERFGLGRGRDTVSMGEVTIKGGSVAVATDKVDPAPSNGVEAVYCVVVSNLAANAKVAFDGLPSDYGTADVYADGAGCAYLWLPEDWDTTHTITPHLLSASPRGRLGAPVGAEHTFAANGYKYTVTIDSSAGGAVAEQGDPLPLESLMIDDFAVADGYLAIRFTAKPATWLYSFADLISIRSSETLPIPDSADALLDLSSAELQLEGVDAATIVVPLGGATSNRFFKVEGRSP